MFADPYAYLRGQPKFNVGPWLAIESDLGVIYRRYLDPHLLCHLDVMGKKK